MSMQQAPHTAHRRLWRWVCDQCDYVTEWDIVSRTGPRAVRHVIAHHPRRGDTA